MTHSEMKTLIVLEMVAPSPDLETVVFDIPQKTRDEMFEMYKAGASLEEIVSLMPEGDERDRMLNLAKIIDEKIVEEKEEVDTEEV